MTPTARSLAVLREITWLPVVKMRRDLFGCIDILATHPTFGILGVQATTTDHAAARMGKAEPQLGAWLGAGGKFEVWSWGLRGPLGRRKLWTLGRRAAHLKDGAIAWTGATALTATATMEGSCG